MVTHPQLKLEVYIVRHYLKGLNAWLIPVGVQVENSELQHL
jgi:hypothetical protein